MSFGLSLIVTNGSIRRDRGGGQPWSPADLSGVIAFYDPSDLSTLYQDSAGTTPITASGQSVGRMLDKSGLDYHMAQSLAAKKSTYQTDGTKRWILFDGVDDFMESGNIDMTSVSGITLFAAVRKLGTSVASAFHVGNVSTVEPGIVTLFSPFTSTNTYHFRAISSSGTAKNSTADAPEFAPPHRAVVTGRFGETVSNIRVNGAAFGENTPISGSFLNMPAYIGARYGSGSITDLANMEFYGLVLLGREATQEEITQVETWLNNKIGAY